MSDDLSDIGAKLSTRLSPNEQYEGRGDAMTKQECPGMKGIIHGAKGENQPEFNDNPSTMNNKAKAVQCLKILERLKLSPLSTPEARDILHIMHPAGRICDLRKQGYKIETHRCHEATSEGAVSVVAKYVLVGRVGIDE